MQIQDPFVGLSLSALNRLGAGVYERIPSYRDFCPLCAGAGCAVRHGLYYRRVVDLGGAVIGRFPVPRFRCRRRGPRRPRGSTFSVLPAALLPRRRLSRALMLQVLDLVRLRGSVSEVLDALAATERGAEGALVLEATTIYRVLALMGRKCGRSRQRPSETRLQRFCLRGLGDRPATLAVHTR